MVLIMKNSATELYNYYSIYQVHATWTSHLCDRREYVILCSLERGEEAWCCAPCRREEQEYGALCVCGGGDTTLEVVRSMIPSSTCAFFLTPPPSAAS